MTTMTRTAATPWTALACIALTLGLLTIPGSAEPEQAIAASEPLRDAMTVEQWSDRVWQSAKSGDRDNLQSYLSRLPQSDDSSPEFARLQEKFTQYLINRTAAQEQRDKTQAEALEELHKHMEADELSQALVAAVEYQSVAKDMTDALQVPEIRQVIALAAAKVEQAEQEGDWLLKQELLYRLRTLYEDTAEIEKYDAYKARLEQTNRRVMLLAEYAPRFIHNLRIKQAARLGSGEIPEFNPATSEDWKEHVDGIDHKVVLKGLDEAAAEHIEAHGWRPLIEGGLEALRVLATTPQLAETFPGLTDESHVDQWVRYIDGQLASLRAMPENEGQLRRRAWDLIKDNLPIKNSQTIKLNPEVMYREFADGAMSGMDEYSEFIWPYEQKRFEQATQGNFVGVGILIKHDEKRDIVVVKPLEGSPAYFAGIKPEDRIVEVDGATTVGWSLNDAVDRITGKEGTEVVLGLSREGEDELIQVEITRRVIKLYSVDGWWKESLDHEGRPVWDWYVDKDAGIAYIKLTDFSKETPRDLANAWRQINRAGDPRGLILDLRFNPGGLLTSAVEITNLFLSKGLIVAGEDRNKHEQWKHEAMRNHAQIGLTHIPVIVLVNKGSASASEIVAGALQAHGAAIILGERTYGKGSVQTVSQIAEETFLKLTTQYYRLPPTAAEKERGEVGRLVHKRLGARDWGVNPDLIVEMTPDQVVKSIELRQSADLIAQAIGEEVKERPDVNDLIVEGIDPQLETALLLLQVRAIGSSDMKHVRLN